MWGSLALAGLLLLGCGNSALAADWPPVPYPHPMITEVLYAVPTGDEGDASGDGSRHVSGDEFIELVNPHDRAIQLQGYVITDRNAPRRGQLRFEFPKLTLEPGEVVVVFNGNEQDWSKVGNLGEKIGDGSRAPKKVNEQFHDALVLTMGITSQREAWANGGDYALLSSPKGEAVQCVMWGSFDAPVPAALVVHQAPVSSQSVQWDVKAEAFETHASLDGELYSPGAFATPEPKSVRKEAARGSKELPARQPASESSEEPETASDGRPSPDFVGPMPVQPPGFVGPPVLD